MTKHVVVALTSIYGIGDTRAKQICSAAGVPPETPVKDLAEPEVAGLRSAVTVAFAIDAACQCEVSVREPMLVPARVRGDRSRDKSRSGTAGSIKPLQHCRSGNEQNETLLN